MKKFLSILLLVVMVLTTFSACSKGATTSDNSTGANVNIEVDTNVGDETDSDVAIDKNESSIDSEASSDKDSTSSNEASNDKNPSKDTSSEDKDSSSDKNTNTSKDSSSADKDSSSDKNENPSKDINSADKNNSSDKNNNTSKETGSADKTNSSNNKNSSSNTNSADKNNSSDKNNDSSKDTSSGDKDSSSNNKNSSTNTSSANKDDASNTSSANKNSSTSDSKDNVSNTNSNGSSTTDSLRGTTVTIASWEDFDGTERANVMQKFTKETGIKVKVVSVTQNDYIVKMASRLNAGKSVDIFIDNQEFPRTLSFAQPITNAGIDVKDAKWDQTIVNTSTINGKTYLINAKWDLKYFVLSYNKSLFEGITSPEDYVKNNNWTWDTFAKAAQAISNLGSEYVGAHFSTPIFMAAYGASYVKYDSTKQEFYRATDEKQFTDVWTYILDGQKAGYLNPTYNSAKLVAGTCGMSINDVFALQKDGYYTSMKASDWGFTYLPKKSASDPDYPKASLMFAYGLMKGAPNPEAAGVFLNYYLDEKNWNFDNYYANSAAKDFANILNKRTPDSTDYMFICKGPLAITYTYGYSEIDKIFLQLTSKQVNQGVNRSANKIENAVKKANDMIKAVG